MQISEDTKDVYKERFPSHLCWTTLFSFLKCCQFLVYSSEILCLYVCTSRMSVLTPLQFLNTVPIVLCLAFFICVLAFLAYQLL